MLRNAFLGGSEETTTGVHRLYALEHAKQLTFPMIAVNDSYCKYLFDKPLWYRSICLGWYYAYY